MALRLTRSLPQPKDPIFTFTTQRNVSSIGRLLAEHRGHHLPMRRFYALTYSFLVYDHYAQAYAFANGIRGGIRAAWLELADNANVIDLYRESLAVTDQGRIGAIEFDLPIHSASPLFSQSAPRHKTPGLYPLDHLTCREFVEIAWQVRCNLLHGSYDPCDDATWSILCKTARPMTALAWSLMRRTQL